MAHTHSDTVQIQGSTALREETGVLTGTLQ